MILNYNLITLMVVVCPYCIIAVIPILVINLVINGMSRISYPDFHLAILSTAAIFNL